MKLPAALLCALTLLSVSSGPARADSHPLFPWYARITASRADLSGYLQTPAGGQPGTATVHHPTFRELNIDSAPVYSGVVERRFRNGILIAGARLLNPHETATLRGSFIAQNRQFDQGSTATTHLRLSWYRLGGLYHLPHRWLHQRLSLWAGADLAAFDFAIHIHQDNRDAQRSYMKTGLRLGGRADYRAGRRLRLQLSAFTGVPLPNTPDITSLEMTANYRLWRERNRAADLVAGVDFERMEYEDQQTEPNHILVRSGPMPMLGVAVHF